MTQTTVTSAPSAPSATATPSGLRSLHLIRVLFSLIWVALVFTTSASLVSTDRPTVSAAVLLVVYPLWDAIATLLERRLARQPAPRTASAPSTWGSASPPPPE